MKAKVLILIADGSPDRDGLRFDAKGVQFKPDATGHVPVALEGRFDTIAGILGKAKLEMVNDLVIAEVDLAEHLLPAHAGRCLYPRAWGEARSEDKTVVECSIGGVNLTIAPNSDERIKSLFQQGARINEPPRRAS